ncbi:MAG TPA: cellulase family glycosylhydrolase, partial [Anaerolineae bacterium]
MRKNFIWFLGIIILAAIAFLARDAIRTAMFNVTGEDGVLPAARGTFDYLTNFTRAMPDTADSIPTAYAGVNPFGVNTFLEQEVEPAKRDRSLQMIADAGFKWIRQQFPWADIEISGKGNYQDCRDTRIGCIDAWAKYDNIVQLAEQHGIDLVVRLEAPPKWARSTPGDFSPPSNLGDFGDYVAAVAARYRGRIQFYQIWNEPNNYPE